MPDIPNHLQSPLRNFLAFFCILIICITAYSNCFSNSFMLDDFAHFFDNESLDKISYTGLLSQDYLGFYRPFPLIILKYLFSIFAHNSAAYHIINLILFLIINFLIFKLVLSLFKNYSLAVLTACIWAAHPIQNFLINYKTSFNIHIQLICMLLCLQFFIRWQQKKRAAYYVLSLITFSLSMLSHEISFMLIMHISLVLLFFSQNKLRVKFLSLCPYLLLFFVYLIIRSNILDLRAVDTLFKLNLSFQNYIITLNQLIYWYVEKLIYPRDILFIWDVVVTAKHYPAACNSLTLIFLAAILLIFIILKKTNLTFCYLFFLVGFLPVCIASFAYTNLSQTAIIEPHWLYFPSIGFFSLVARFVLNLQKKINKRIWGGFLISILMLLVTLTHKSNNVWKTERSYCLYWIVNNPLNPVPWDRYANSYRSANKENELILALDTFDGYLINQKSHLAYANRGNVYLKLNSLENAISDYNHAVKLSPFFSEALIHRGVSHAMLGQYELAMNDLTRVLKFDPTNAAALSNSAIVLRQLKTRQTN